MGLVLINAFLLGGRVGGRWREGWWTEVFTERGTFKLYIVYFYYYYRWKIITHVSAKAQPLSWLIGRNVTPNWATLLKRELAKCWPAKFWGCRKEVGFLYNDSGQVLKTASNCRSIGFPGTHCLAGRCGGTNATWACRVRWWGDEHVGDDETELALSVPPPPPKKNYLAQLIACPKPSLLAQIHLIAFLKLAPSCSLLTCGAQICDSENLKDRESFSG